MFCRSRDREDSRDRDHYELTCRGREPQKKWGRNRNRHRRHASEDSEDRSRSRSDTQSAHSIRIDSFQDHPDLHERLPSKLHESHSFQDPCSNTDYVNKTFHSIYRSKLVASTSNETDPDGKTKIITLLKIKLPH